VYNKIKQKGRILQRSIRRPAFSGKLCRHEMGGRLMDQTDRMRKILGNMNTEERKSLMESTPEEIADKWEKMYKIPIKQSRFFLNDLFFHRSWQNKDDH
jgi:hypothetical protein